MDHALLNDRAVLAVTGGDARPFLQGLLTNDLGAVAPGRPQWTALLSAQGKILFDMILHDGGDGAVLIDCEATAADALARRLAMYRLRRAVEIAPQPLGVHAAWGGARGVPDPRLAALGTRWIAPPQPGTRGTAAYRHHRIALGVAEGAVELGQDMTLWLEANAVELNGVSFTKGCYVGQENTARMHHKDKLRRRLLPVALTADPGEAQTIMASDRAAGELRARAGDAGIAWLRLEYAQAALELGGVPVTIRWPDWLPRDI